MMFKKFIPFGLILFLVFFGLVVEGFGQVTRDCLICSPNANSQASRFDLGTVSFTDALGNPIDLSTCPDKDNIYITFSYSTGQNTNQIRTNVFFVSNLEITDNTLPVDSPNRVREGIFDFLIGDLPTTGPGFVTHTIKVDLPLEFDCQKETARMKDIRIHWSNPGRPDNNANNNNFCDGINYPPGQCSNLQTAVRTITVDGFFYSFGVTESCFEEDNLTFRTFVLTNVAGGNGVYDVIWTVTKNGITRTDPARRLPEGLFITEPASPNDIIEVSVLVRDSNGLTMATPPNAEVVNIPEPFQVSIEVSQNLGDITPFPNGSIRLTNIDPSKTFSYEWFDEDGIQIQGDPTNLTGLPDGTYFLFMTDENGVVRCFSRSIRFFPTPVIYENLSLEFKPSFRSVNFLWSTTKEWEASHFEIERAVSGTRFEKIGEVKAAGWSDQLTEYLFEDKLLPLAGGNLLYRLKQVDFNGDFEYSKVLSVRVPGMQITNGVWRIFPNPTIGDALRIELLDSKEYNGESLMANLITPTAGRRSLKGNTTQTIAEEVLGLLNANGKGVYVLEISWGQRIEYIKLIKN
ncbi:T9SS type A sorting domain-containing protein [Fontibacter flavus]|uniref:T9SS type A sorting domain-containing protein n=1 Tax=Fontibacter flavus TaxID=654838 RepID=A0ABV6FPZ7_9BACT